MEEIFSELDKLIKKLGNLVGDLAGFEIRLSPELAEMLFKDVSIYCGLPIRIDESLISRPTGHGWEFDILISMQELR